MKRIILLLALFLCVTAFNKVFAQWVSMVYDINQSLSSNSSSSPSNLYIYNNKLYFAANDGIHGNELWECDGINGPAMVADIYKESGSSTPYSFKIINNKLYFIANDDHGYYSRRYWKFNGVNVPKKVDNNLGGNYISDLN